jgi:cutinase
VLGLASPGLQLHEAVTAQYGKGNVGSIANTYPAVSISWRLVRTSRTYGPSVAAARRALRRNVADLISLCPRSALILGGFSQGAQVTHFVPEPPQVC